MGVDVNEAGSRIRELLQPEQPSSTEEEVAQQDVSAEVEQEAQESSEEPSSLPDTEDYDETPDGDTEPEPRYTVKVNGEDQDVSLEDLRKGYMMESDYRKKTSEVARAREEVQSKYADLDTKIAEAEGILKLDLEDLNSEESLELKEIDPSEWYAKKEKIEGRAKRLETLRQDQYKRFVEARKAVVDQEKELLLQALPEWLDEGVMNKEAGAVQKMWSDMGIPQETLDQLTDHRLVLISRKAMLYDQLMSANPKDKQVKQKPKAAKPSVTKSSDERVDSATKAAKQKLKKTGNMRDAQAVIMQLMK